MGMHGYTPQKPARNTRTNAHGQEINWSTLASKMLDIKSEVPGFVYVIREDDNGPYKIGFAASPIKRLRGLQTGNPRALKIEHLICGTVETERFLHAWARPHVILGRVRNSFSGVHARDTEWFTSESYEETAILLEDIASDQLIWADDPDQAPTYDFASIASAHVNHHPREVHAGATIRLLAEGSGYVEHHARAIN